MNNAWKRNLCFNMFLLRCPAEIMPLDNHNYMTPFLDHEEGDGIFINLGPF